MKDLIENMISDLTDAEIIVDLDPELDALGATYPGVSNFVIAINVPLHSACFGEGALEQLWDTIRHEVAHVEHIRSLQPSIAAKALEWHLEGMAAQKKYGITPLSWERQIQIARGYLTRGIHSHHGSEWKKHARKLGAIPKARA
jgi:hypothetical protein